MTRADLDAAIAKVLARALVAALRTEMARIDESPATAGTVQGSEETTNNHDHRTPTAA
jgi:hypothetical protein